jgi:hypothetical protein
MTTSAPPVETPPLPAGSAPRRGVHRSWWLVAFLAFAVAGYALSFYVRRSAAFPPDLFDSFTARPWGIYSHVLFGSLALILGPFQFRRTLLVRNRPLHRRMGLIYVVSATMTGLVGLYMSAYSFGGMNTHLGFGVLGALTAFTTLKAYTRIRALDVRAHREWMIRSFALIFGAVTLRIELPLLIVAYQGAFPPAYAIVSWLSWVPNLIWAEWYIRHSRHTEASSVPQHSRAS